METSEYKTAKTRAESDAVKTKTMSLGAVRCARDTGRVVTARLGLTPERVWELTAHMRRTGGEA